LWDTDPSIALDASNRVHIAFDRSLFESDCADGPCTYGVWYVTNRSGAFSAPKRISAAGLSGTSIKVYAGAVYIAYGRYTYGPSDGELPSWHDSVYLATNASGSWRSTRVEEYGSTPSLRIGTDGKARVAFRSAEGWIGYSDVGSGSTAYLSSGHRPSLALDAANRPRIAWTGDEFAGSSGTRVARRSSTGWSVRTLTARTDSSGPAIAVDATDKTHVLLAPDGGGIHYYTDQSGAWVSTALTSTLISTGKVSLRIDPANRPVVMFAARSGTSYGLYYARRP
jgi:hypothetical protein